jgi:tetratricopeptide (TPR) repeat protein
MSRSRPKPLLLAVTLLALALPARADNTFDSAVADYNAKNFNAALDKLHRLDRVNPNNEKVRYYMALCYQGAAQIASAKAEYTWVAENARDGTMRRNAQEALEKIDHWSLKRAYSGNGNYYVRTGSRQYSRRPVMRYSPTTFSSGGKT